MRQTILIRGGGDIATGVAYRLKRCGYAVGILEIEKPTVIRRTVAFATAVYDETICVEGITAKRFAFLDETLLRQDDHLIPIAIDEKGLLIDKVKPDIVVDCILAKRNMGTHIEMAPIVVAIGPGFEAGVDVHAVVETKRGHHLGQVFYEGHAEKDTGIPESVLGYAEERVIRACCDGKVALVRQIGDLVEAGDIVCTVEGKPVISTIRGMLRGMIQENSQVYTGMKIGDVDPRGQMAYCYAVSDKARAVGGGVLEAILTLEYKHMEANRC